MLCITGASAYDFNQTSTSTDIQGYIDNSGDDVIELKAGNYSLKEINITRNLTIKNKGSDVVNIRGDGLNTLFNVKSAYVTIQGLNIIDYKVAINSSASYLTIKNNRITSTKDPLFNSPTNDTTGIIIDITNNSGDAFLNNIIIESNFIDTKYEGIIFNITSLSGDSYMENITINYNILESSNKGGIYSDTNAYVKNVSLNNNFLTTESGTPFYLSAANIDNLQFNDNELTGSSTATIINLNYMLNATNIKIIGNTLISGGNVVGINISSRLESSDANITNLLIEDNNINTLRTATGNVAGTKSIILVSNSTLKNFQLSNNIMNGLHGVSNVIDGIIFNNNTFYSTINFGTNGNFPYTANIPLQVFNNFTFNNNKINITDHAIFFISPYTTNLTLENNTGYISGRFLSTGSGGVKNLRMENNNFTQLNSSTANLIYALGPSFLEDVFIYNNTASRVQFDSGSGHINNVTIYNNHLTGINVASISSDVSNVNITNNTINSTVQNGVLTIRQNGKLINLTIENNIIFSYSTATAATNNVVYLYTSGDNSYYENIIINNNYINAFNAGNGMRIYVNQNNISWNDFNIFNNTIETKNGYGILFDFTKYIYGDNGLVNISNNRIKSSNNGINFNFQKTATDILKNLVIFNNTIESTTKGIYLNANTVKDALIKGNNIIGRTHGIDISANNIENITINYNSILSSDKLLTFSALATGNIDYNWWGSNTINATKFSNTPTMNNHYNITLDQMVLLVLGMLFLLKLF
ncbi:hypothetical protein [Methanobrevibacter cuticularis]|nr:hypothetical protein [Methanobrevibacter cuticularis]